MDPVAYRLSEVLLAHVLRGSSVSEWVTGQEHPLSSVPLHSNGMEDGCGDMSLLLRDGLAKNKRSIPVFFFRATRSPLCSFPS